MVFYYVGHGGFLADREYFLVLRSTKKGREQLRGLRIRALAQLLKEHAPQHRVYLILDCCFAGEAVREFRSGELGLLLEKETFDAMCATGTALLVAAFEGRTGHHSDRSAPDDVFRMLNGRSRGWNSGEG